MSELLREVLDGFTGKAIRDELLLLIKQLDEAALQSARISSQPYTDVRYRVGCADGVRVALKTIMDLGSKKT